MVNLNNDFLKAIYADIYGVVQNIYSDVWGNLENPCNEDLIEVAIDQKHQCSQKVQKLIDEAIAQHGYDKVFKFMNRNMRFA